MIEPEAASLFMEEAILPMLRAQPLTIAFLGCGHGGTESAIVRTLANRFHRIHRVVFMDKVKNSDLTQAIDTLTQDLPVKIEYVASYAELERGARKWAIDSMLVPIGVNNSIKIKTELELWDAWRFFVTCEELRRTECVARDYINILDNDDGTYDRFSYDVYGTMAVPRYGWFEYASLLISDRGARSLLTSPKTPPCQREEGIDQTPSPRTRC
jgi:hypothetical protein